MMQNWPVGILVGSAVVVALVSLLPVFIARARRHHQRLAISALVVVPLLPAVAGLLLLAAANVGGLWFAYLGLYVLPVPWFLALVWSLTAVRYVPVASATPAARSAASAPAALFTEAELEERRRERRARGY